MDCSISRQEGLGALEKELNKPEKSGPVATALCSISSFLFHPCFGFLWGWTVTWKLEKSFLAYAAFGHAVYHSNRNKTQDSHKALNVHPQFWEDTTAEQRKQELVWVPRPKGGKKKNKARGHSCHVTVRPALRCLHLVPLQEGTYSSALLAVWSLGCLCCQPHESKQSNPTLFKYLVFEFERWETCGPVRKQSREGFPLDSSGHYRKWGGWGVRAARVQTNPYPRDTAGLEKEL